MSTLSGELKLVTKVNCTVRLGAVNRSVPRRDVSVSLHSLYTSPYTLLFLHPPPCTLLSLHSSLYSTFSTLPLILYSLYTPLHYILSTPPYTIFSLHPLLLHFQITVRAQFDYDVTEDDFLPCVELGVGFKVGSILHVINRDDPHWWQVSLNIRVRSLCCLSE